MEHQKNIIMNAQDLYIIVGLEESQAITIELRKLGVNAFSCDIKPCSGGHPEWHILGDVFRAVNAGAVYNELGKRIFIDKWHAGIFHPVCTYLSVTANKWLKDQPARKSGALVGAERRTAREEAIGFFMQLTNLDIPYCLENPVGCMSSVWRKPDQIIQPMQFGHPEPKKTCLWLKGLPNLIPTHTDVEPEYHITKSGKRLPKWYAYADKSKGQAHRAEIRSKTFSGIAQAMANQWVSYLLNPQPKEEQQLTLSL